MLLIWALSSASWAVRGGVTQRHTEGCMAAAGSPDHLGVLPSFLPAMTPGEPLHVKTPIRDSMSLSKVAGTSVYLKMDSAQPSGSFKIRGIGHLCKMVQEGSAASE